MKFSLALSLIVNLSISLCNAQSENTALMNQIVTKKMIQKAELTSDPIVKALVTQQAIVFSKRHGFAEDLWGDLNALAFDVDFQLNNPTYPKNSAQQRKTEVKGYSKFHGIPAKKGGMPAVRSIVVSNDNSSYYSAGGDGKIIKHSITTGASETVILEKDLNRIGSISSEERYLAYITSRDEMAIVDLLHLDETPQDVNGHSGSIKGFAFLPDSSGHYVTVGIDHQVILHSGDANRVLFVCDYPPTTLELSPSGDLLAVGGRSGEFEIFSFNAANAKADLAYRIRREGIAIQKVSFSADGQKIALGITNYSDSYGYVEIRDVIDSTVSQNLISRFKAPITDIKFSENGKYLAAGARDNTVKVWRIEGEGLDQQSLVFDDARDWIWSIDFTSDSKRLFSASKDGMIRQYPLELNQYQTFCDQLSRNLSEKEWRSFVGDPKVYPYEKTCSE